ncbi:unnamed protein product [Merluccius merluccius]
MNSIKNSSIKFAALQFATRIHKVFDFNEYQEGKATKLLDAEPFMKALTNTYRALKYTLHSVFESKSAGASPESTKVVVIITDGDPSDSDDDKIMEEYDKKKIIRFVIGIGSYFGAELCLVDVQSDNDTDFLLVGAPLFHHPQDKREGHIYVYKLTQQQSQESVSLGKRWTVDLTLEGMDWLTWSLAHVELFSS